MVDLPLINPLRRGVANLKRLVEWLLKRDQMALLIVKVDEMSTALDDLNEQFYYFRTQHSPSTPSPSINTTFRGGNLPSPESVVPANGNGDGEGMEGEDKDPASIFMQSDDDLAELEMLEQARLKRGGVVTLEDDLEDLS